MIGSVASQKPFADYWSGDSAFQQLSSSDATAEEIKAWEQKVRVAREMQDWSALAIEGETPTRFVMRPISYTTLRRLLDDYRTGTVKTAELAALAFRAAIQHVENHPDLVGDIPRTKHPRYGLLASEAFADKVDSIDMSIITELGNAILDRAGGPSPKP